MQVLVIDQNTPSYAFNGLPMAVALLMRHLTKARYGSLQVTVPDGRIFAFNGTEEGPAGVLEVHDWNLIKRCADSGDVGVGESYISGEWSSPDVTVFLEYFVANAELLDTNVGKNPLVRLWLNLRHWLNRNNKSGSRRNISAHYDLGNEFYSRWLDSSMTYSSALYATGANDLATAQNAKYRALAESTDIRSGHHVLEIGCGFGGFAEFVAGEIGAKVTALTISKEQHKYCLLYTSPSPRDA